MPDSILTASTEVLADHVRNGKTECHHRQEKGLDNAYADSKTRLCRRTKTSDDRVDDHDVHKEQQKLRPRRDTDPQHASPDFGLRAKQRKPKTEITIFLFEINHHQHVGNENGDE